MVTGAGYNSCGAWTKAQGHRPPIGAHGLLHATFADMDLVQPNFVGPRVSLSVQLLRQQFRRTYPNGIDNNGIFAWIDNYCAAHPLDSIATATIALVAELSKRSGQ